MIQYFHDFGLPDFGGVQAACNHGDCYTNRIPVKICFAWSAEKALLGNTKNKLKKIIFFDGRNFYLTLWR